MKLPDLYNSFHPSHQMQPYSVNVWAMGDAICFRVDVMAQSEEAAQEYVRMCYPSVDSAIAWPYEED